jgi:hypothetical protein
MSVALTSRFPVLRGAVVMAAAALLQAGCMDAVAPPETFFWEGDLAVTPGGPPDLFGSVAMVATAVQTQIGIGVESEATGASFGWIVRDGTCAAPGAPVAPQLAFPAVATGLDNVGEAETVLHRRLTGTVYAAQLLENADGSGGILACADLARRT